MSGVSESLLCVCVLRVRVAHYVCRLCVYAPHFVCIALVGCFLLSLCWSRALLWFRGGFSWVGLVSD